MPELGLLCQWIYGCVTRTRLKILSTVVGSAGSSMTTRSQPGAMGVIIGVVVMGAQELSVVDFYGR